MKSQIREIFPGGNTPLGFHSYYNYILPQRKAEKIFCIKGGPGVGKSTLMKSLAKHFSESGERIELFYCSADPASLDGVLFKDRNIAIVDGTVPHVIDPMNPGAVDEIIDLGRFLNKNGLKKYKDQIINCSEMISARFNAAYVYLKHASVYYEYMHQLTECNVYFPADHIGTMVNELAVPMSIRNKRGTVRKFFAGAITSDGIKSSLYSLKKNIDNVLMIEVPVGINVTNKLNSISSELTGKGYDVEEFYCPMDPKGKLEHIVSEDAGIAVFTVNEYHGRELLDSNDGSSDVFVKKVFDINGLLNEFENDMYQRAIKNSKTDISAAISLLKKAKELHDILESYYIENMDFERIDEVRRDVIAQIG